MTTLADLTDAELIAALAVAIEDEPGLTHALAVMCSTFDIRALTVRFPWSALIADGEKGVENRTWGTKYRGPVLIHSSAARGDMDHLPVNPKGPQYRVPEHLQARGSILALANITGCHPFEPGCCPSAWAEPTPGVFHWAVSGVLPLSRPIPAKGRLGLWKPGRELIVDVLRQLRETADA
jgi:activating signal cointegrator 1